MTFIENPEPSMVKKWGPLAYVSDSERAHILDLPFGAFKPTVTRIEKEIKAMEKRRKKAEAAKKQYGRMGENKL